MNATLVKNRPADIDKEKFVAMWNNAGYTLEALQKTIKEWEEAASNISIEDFDCPNHYQKMVFQAGQVKAFQRILALMPESLKV